MTERNNWPVYVLSTSEAGERQEAMRAWLATVPELADFKMFVSERDRENTRRGCFKAHQRWASEMLKDPNTDWAIVFEDDVTTPLDSAGVSSLLRALKQFVSEEGKDADVVFLGHMPLGPMRAIPFSPFAWSEHSTLTHAMAVSRAAAERLLSWDAETSGHVDQMIAFSGMQQAALYPQAMFQKDLPSFHTRWQERVLMRMRNIVGARAVVRVAELAAMHAPRLMIKRRPRDRTQ